MICVILPYQPPTAGGVVWPQHRGTRAPEIPGGKMGDKGGKKDKEKGKKQNASKQKQKAKIKEDRRPKRKP